MWRLLWTLTPAILLLSCQLALADSTALVTELEGRLVRNGDEWFLRVGGDGDWSLDFSSGDGFETNKEECAKIFKRYPDGKVFIRGSVRYRIIGQTIQIVSRQVKVQQLSRMTPVVKVTSIELESPAAEHLKVGDIIVGINQTEITDYAQLVKIVYSRRGQKVDFAIIRQGKGRLIKAVGLRVVNSPLGINGKTAWITAYDIAAAPPMIKPGDD